MFSYCTNYDATMPDIVVYMNCDTRLAINLSRFGLTESDEFIFAIKNYSYIDSSYVFLLRAKVSDMNNNGEILFKIPPATARRIKPGAFYNFSVLLNAFDPRKDTEYKKLTNNGNIIIDYGAQDIRVWKEDDYQDTEVVGVHLEPTDDFSELESNMFMGEIVNMRVETVDED